MGEIPGHLSKDASKRWVHLVTDAQNAKSFLLLGFNKVSLVGGDTIWDPNEARHIDP